MDYRSGIQVVSTRRRQILPYTLHDIKDNKKATLAKPFHGENKPKGQILNVSNNI